LRAFADADYARINGRYSNLYGRGMQSRFGIRSDSAARACDSRVLRAIVAQQQVLAAEAACLWVRGCWSEGGGDPASRSSNVGMSWHASYQLVRGVPTGKTGSLPLLDQSPDPSTARDLRRNCERDAPGDSLPRRL